MNGWTERLIDGQMDGWIDNGSWIYLYLFRHGAVCFEERLERCCTELRHELRRLNSEIEHHVRFQCHKAADNIAANIRYQFLEHHGPRRTHITLEEPFTPRYFVMIGGGPDLTEEEIEGPRGVNVVANNGWVMNGDPLVNFAEEGSEVSNI